MLVKLFTVTVLCQIILINFVSCASIRNSTTSSADNLSTTSTTPKSSIIQPSNSNFSLAPRTETITHGTTIKPNLIKVETTAKQLPKKVVVKREKKEKVVPTSAATPTMDDGSNMVTVGTQNDELANALKKKFQETQNRIQDVFNSTKERIQAQNKKLQQEMDVVNKSDTLAESEAQTLEVAPEIKKDKKEGAINAKIADNTIPAFAAAASIGSMPTLPPQASIDEPLKQESGSGSGSGMETISFTKTVDLPLINKPNDKQNVFVVGGKKISHFF
uniref:Uncharacterized protein n=1 Tax=Panagrolaimus sp. ES5 TaxID=591445 RepID=A0AC34FYC5_9BILA